MADNELYHTGGFTIQPNTHFDALTVPAGKTFVLTDVIVFPLVEKGNPDFVIRYRIEEGKYTRFQNNTVGTEANWSQHFSSGIKFQAGNPVKVVSTGFSTGVAGFQLMGYLTTP